MSQSRGTHVRDLVFADSAHGALALDLFLPARPNDMPVPLIIWVHGGGWFTGDRTLSPDLTARAEATGFAYASIEYRLSGEALFPAQLVDVRTAIRFLREHAAQWGIDPALIGLWGASAGGHLAALAGLTGQLDHVPGEDPDAALGDASVRAVAAGYPPVNLAEVVADSIAARPDSDPLMFPECRLLGGLPSEFPVLSELANPITHVTESAPAFQLAHGTADPLVHHHQSAALHEALIAAGAASELYLLEGYKHGFLNPPGRLDVQLRNVMDDGRLDTEGAALAEYRGRDGIGRAERFGFETVDAFFQAHLRAAD